MNEDTELRTLGVDVPAWIDQDITVGTVTNIVQDGCESGVYMPAVVYAAALDTMCQHGDNVLQYIDDTLGELPTVPSDIGWSTLACRYLSIAVELWAASVDELSRME